MKLKWNRNVDSKGKTQAYSARAGPYEALVYREYHGWTSTWALRIMQENVFAPVVANSGYTVAAAKAAAARALKRLLAGKSNQIDTAPDADS